MAKDMEVDGHRLRFSIWDTGGLPLPEWPHHLAYNRGNSFLVRVEWILHFPFDFTIRIESSRQCLGIFGAKGDQW